MPVFYRNKTEREHTYNVWENILSILPAVFSYENFRVALPYRTGRHIGVMSSHLTNHRVNSSIFMHFQ